MTAADGRQVFIIVGGNSLLFQRERNGLLSDNSHILSQICGSLVLSFRGSLNEHISVFGSCFSSSHV